MRRLLKFLLLIVIATAILCAFVGIPMLIGEWPRMHFQKRLKARTTTQELQAWATATLAPYQTNNDPALCIELTKLPPAFHGLYNQPPSAYIYARGQTWFGSDEPGVHTRITYGSAAGHFGVVLGPTNLPTPANREHEIRYTAWAPGVWFFDGQ